MVRIGLVGIGFMGMNPYRTGLACEKPRENC